MREAVIVNALRTAIGKGGRGALKDARPDDLYVAGDGSFEFERTASRLNEMLSDDWLSEGHGAA